MRGFVLEFCFPDFRFFWQDLWVILLLCIFVCSSVFCEFLDFLYFRKVLVLVVFWISPFSRNSRPRWFLSCLSLHHRFGRQPSTLLNFPTSVLFLLPPHTTAHLQPNHTLPSHNHTLAPFTQDLTPDPAVDMCGATHAWTSNTWKTDKHTLGCHGGGDVHH